MFRAARVALLAAVFLLALACLRSRVYSVFRVFVFLLALDRVRALVPALALIVKSVHYFARGNADQQRD